MRLDFYPLHDGVILLCAYRMYLVRVSEMRELFMLKMASVEDDATAIPQFSERER